MISKKQYEEAVFNAFGRCYGDIAWAKKQASDYWIESELPENECPDFFDALISAKSHVSIKPNEWSNIIIAAKVEADATFRQTGSFPKWWNEDKLVAYKN